MTIHIGKEFIFGFVAGVAGTLYFTKKDQKRKETPKYEYRYTIKSDSDEEENQEKEDKVNTAFTEKAESLEKEILDLLAEVDELREVFFENDNRLF